MISRGSTIREFFISDIDLRGISNMFITFVQDYKIIFEKTIDDVEILDEGLTIAVDLTQDDTMKLNDRKLVEIQVVGTLNEAKLVSIILTTDVGRLLRDEVF